MYQRAREFVLSINWEKVRDVADLLFIASLSLLF